MSGRATTHVIVVLSTALAAAAQSPAKIPRTPDGHPDLQGTWSNSTLTPLERPADFAGKPALTESEAVAYEKALVESLSSDRRAKTAQADLNLAYNDVFFDRGTKLARVHGSARTSLIVDPPDGKIPALTEEAQKRNAARPRNSFDSVKDRPLGERCLLGFGSTDVPLIPVYYNNNFQITQSPTTIAILIEMIHDVRFIHMDRSEHLPQEVRQWLGDSIGHWEADTLVVDTTNFTDKTRFNGSDENLHVTERFTRVSRDAFLYKFTIEDPTTFTKPWSAEYPFLAVPGPIYEYACHEGNYAMTGILAGARAQEKAAAEKAAQAARKKEGK